MSTIKASTRSSNFSRASSGRNSSKQQRSQRFWCHQMVSYPLIAMQAIGILTLFVTSYLWEQSFSRFVDIKPKKRNRLCCENYMRVALAKVKPRISELVYQKQQQRSHWYSVNIHRVIFLCEIHVMLVFFLSQWFCVHLMHCSFGALIEYVPFIY